jgi:hypothetical protein
MPMKLYATALNSTDAAAAIDVREDLTIEGIFLNLTAAAPIDNATIKMEVSFGSTSAFTSNDTTASLASLAIATEAGAAGTAQFGQAVFIPMAEKVQAGERIYLHINTSGGATTVQATAYIYGGGSARPSTRRR